MRNSPPKLSPSPWKNCLPAFLIFFAVIAAFWPVYSAGFIWDDNVMLTDTPLMRGPFLALWTGASGVDYFPVTYSSLWIEWHLWGPNALGYHLTNVLIHAASCIILWRIFVRLKFPAPTFAALLFAIHPVNVESVAWIAERKNVLAMLFYTVTAWAFVRFLQSDQRKWYAVSIAAFLLSLLAKPAAVSWPIIAVGMAWWFTQPKRDTVPTLKLIKWTAPFFIIAIALGLITIWCQYHFAIKGDAVYDRDLVTRIATAATAIWFYLAKAVVPWPLSFVYPMWQMSPLSIVHWLPAIALVAAIGILWNFRHTSGKPLLIALIYFILLLAPVLGILKISFQRYSYVADHWQYFSLPAVTILIAMAVKKFPYQKLITTALVLVFACLTFAQARNYRSMETIWADTLAKNPNSWVALGGLGLERMKAGQVEEGIALCEKSLQIYPNQGESHANVGLALLQVGRVGDGIQHLRDAIRIEPDYIPTYCNLGDALKRQGKIDEAAALYREAMRRGPTVPLPYNYLGSLLAEQRHIDEATELFRKAVALAPDYENALCNLGAALTSQNKPSEALPILQKAVALNPGDPSARANLGNALLDLKKAADARTQFEAALQLNPDCIPAKYGLADCLKMTEQTQ